MSSDAVIQVEGLGKRYRLGARLEPRTTLREQINRLAQAPYRRLQAVLRGEPARALGDELWAVKDISLALAPGEAVGVIGRNGAGKSTLLKILSRITEPTHGRAEIRGRVGSLLEVGSGFHSELTGRENVFLNGVILGMKRAEIAAKLDQIIAFAGVERFIDTQVKHYSSGMALRLAFAVAAHLQPEILLIDEVLAVGDAAFQRKCLGKMSDVAEEGRAILFVSHNLEAVQRLCNRCIWLEGGRLRLEGPPDAVVRAYLEQDSVLEGSSYKGERGAGPDEPVVLQKAAVFNALEERSETVCFGEPFSIRQSWDVARSMPGVEFIMYVRDASERLVFSASTHGSNMGIETGTKELVCQVQENVLLPGDYGITLVCLRPPRACVHRVERCLRLRVLDVAVPGRNLPHLRKEALVAPATHWEVPVPRTLALSSDSA
jgi:ABC-type polysaccharide/polyol phosphate transport system ATPase subunit